MTLCEEGALRAVTFNILTSEHADWDRRRGAVRSLLRAVRPDVVALQETDVRGGEEQATYLLGEQYHVVEHAARETDAVGALLASRWPIRAVHQIDLSVVPRVPSATALLAEVELPAPFGLVRFVHHGAAYQYGYAHERETQAVRCARAIEQLVPDPGEHVVLLGDFNDSPDSSSVRFWTGRQSLDGCSVAYRDAWETVHPQSEEPTFSPDNPLVRAGQMPLEAGRRIDYVMVRCGVYGPTLQVTACELVGDRSVDGVWASDHYGLAADLRVPARSPGWWA